MTISVKFTRWRLQLVVELLVFGRVHQNVAPGSKSAIYDCLVDNVSNLVVDGQERMRIFASPFSRLSLDV